MNLLMALLNRLTGRTESPRATPDEERAQVRDRLANQARRIRALDIQNEVQSGRKGK